MSPGCSVYLRLRQLRHSGFNQKNQQIPEPSAADK
jgi:hypothetical protein